MAENAMLMKQNEKQKERVEAISKELNEFKTKYFDLKHKFNK